MIREKQLGAEHPDVASSLNNLALLYESQGRYGEAEPLYLRAVNIVLKTLPEGHPDSQRVQNNFQNMVRAVINLGQTQQLSKHPLTQAMLQHLRNK